MSTLVETWIGAWNRKDFNGYLNTYAKSFEPAKGMGRAEWEKLRKSRLNKKGDIQAVLSNIKAQDCNGKTSAVSFTQTYSSDDYKDLVEKTLELEKVGSDWKIVRETVTKGRTY